jgi:hypothetical protein
MGAVLAHEDATCQFSSLTLNALTIVVTENWIWLSPVIISALKHTSVVSLAPHEMEAQTPGLDPFSQLPRYHLAASEARELCREIIVLNTSDYCAP